MAKKGYTYPVKKQTPLILLLNLFGNFIVSHFMLFVNIFHEIFQIFSPKYTAILAKYYVCIPCINRFVPQYLLISLYQNSLHAIRTVMKYINRIHFFFATTNQQLDLGVALDKIDSTYNRVHRTVR